MDTDDPWREKLHNLTESLQVFEYVIQLLEKQGYTFSDQDAPHYIAEMKKATLAIRDVRDSLQSLKTQGP